MTSENKLISTVLAVAACALSLAANADRHWTGGGATTDWTDNANWGAGNGSGNWVFGGGEIGRYPSSSDPVVVTFSNLVEISNGVWIENDSKPNVVWRRSEDATEGAGLKSDWGTNNSLNIGTGKHGGLTIESGVYYMPKQLWIGNGAADSYFTLAGGVFTNNSYVCIGYGAHNRTATMTVTGGEFYEKNDKFIIGQGNHASCVGVYNQTGGTVSVPELFMSENNGSSSLALSGGTFEVRSWGRVGMGANTVCDIAVSGGEFDTDGELVLGCGNNSKVDMTLSGGLFKPKKLWVGSRYDSDKMTFTTTGCDATVTVTDNGTLTTDSGQDIVLGGRENANGTLTVEDGIVSCGNTLHVGWKGNGVLDVQGGTVSASIVSLGSDTTDAIGTVSISGGKIATTNGRIYVGNKGTGTLTVNGGEVTWGDQLMVGWESSSSGTLNVNGGTVAKSDHLLQVGLKGHGEFNMTGGDVVCSDFRLGTDSADAVGVANMSGGRLVNGSLSVAGNGTGTFNLNGGVVEANNVVVANYSGTAGTLNLNGGTLKARQNNGTFITASEKLTVNIGENGAVFDSAGYAITIPATLNNADGLVGNGMIWKKGLGTLTISSDLDLARTFKFTINEGVGPIALTGTGNTLGEGKKIAVAIDAVSGETDEPYALITGLDSSYTVADNFTLETPASGLYTCSLSFSEGTLYVTLQNNAAAPAFARWDSMAETWNTYNSSNVLLENTAVEDYTSYVFTGSEPSGAFAALSATHRVVLESGTISIDSAINASRVTIPENATVTLSGSEAASFAATELVNNGTLTIAGEITLDAPLASGNVVIAEGAVVHFVKSQTVYSYFSGSGELRVENAQLRLAPSGSGDTFRRGTEYFQQFSGTLTVDEGGELEDFTDLHGENNSQGPYYFLGTGTTLKMAGGTVTRFGGNSNNENLENIVIADGTTSVWNNLYSRSGNQGCNVNITGTFTGTGTLEANCNGRAYVFKTDLSGFGGTVVMGGSAFQFRNGINGGTWVAKSGSVLSAWVNNAYSPLAVDNATLVLKGSHGAVANVSSGTYTIGAMGTLKVADDASVQGISFADGATLELLDDGSLSDTAQEYVALTSATPIAGELPTLVQPANVGRGKWKLVQKTVPGEGEAPDTYQIVAEFRPAGLVIIIQ